VTVGDRLFVLTVKSAATAGTRVLQLIPDTALLAFSRIKTAEIPWQEGRDFVERLLVNSKRALAEASPECRNKAVVNFFHNYLAVGYVRRKAFAREHGFVPPYLMVISPTMRCNLNCYGCYAGGYSDSELGLEEVIDIVEQGKRMGIFFVVISGGEPFIWERIFDLFEAESDVYFQVYTNGSLIDADCADRLGSLGNVLPCISMEGFREETDSRRGIGHFDLICRAMDLLKERGVLFGFSATATIHNNDTLVSDRFVDFCERKGCFMGWYFNYVPVGRSPAPELMPTPEQRILRRGRLKELRRQRRMVLADFWNDGPLTGGCIAGGRSYLHVNAAGDIEPCVFCHFALHNIREHSLTEVLRSDFFRKIRESVPYCENLLRPCMLIDHPAFLREVVNRYGARPTHAAAEAILGDLAAAMDRYAEEYGRLADDQWDAEYGHLRQLEACGE
jgi:MoaA/NifB/PqqE/SkfB family radical SAM enzyme